MIQVLRLVRIALWGVLTLALLAACGASRGQSMIPAGAAQGQATFLYFYTDA